MTQPCFLRGRLPRLPRLLRQLRLSARGSNEMVVVLLYHCVLWCPEKHIQLSIGLAFSCVLDLFRGVSNPVVSGGGTYLPAIDKPIPIRGPGRLFFFHPANYHSREATQMSI